MAELPIGHVVILLLIACLASLSMRWFKQPYATVLVVTGLAVSFLKLVPNIQLSHDVAFFLLLPPILFHGSMNLSQENVRQDWKPIAFLAVGGIVVSALLIGYPLSWAWHIPLIYALLFGALISPTDPVSVLAIIKQLKAPSRLRTILEAESLFNDGTGVVLFAVFLNMIQRQEPLHLGWALLQFLLVTAGGAAVGGFCAWAASRLIKPIEDPMLEVTLTVVLVLGTPLIAESLHVSGIIAIVAAGLVMGKGRLSWMSAVTRQTVETFWEVIDFILNSIIFLIIGLELRFIGIDHLIAYKWPILAGILVVLVARAVIVYTVLYTYNLVLKNRVPFEWSHILYWGGLRGTIPIILMLQLQSPRFPYTPLFLSATFGIVLFSIIFQGMTIEGLLRKLKLYS
ncbi:MAG: cation:proton antiporter [Candidatus Omnitrophica bacterium]|nr:cation:proton antiporter [Candidatus Omnitrophota bacterium]MDE2222052.1 cation:proton antiporter [Candidatus Omnitrophota bacterium]